MSSVDPRWTPPHESQPYIAAPPPPSFRHRQFRLGSQSWRRDRLRLRRRPCSGRIGSRISSRSIMPLILVAVLATPLGVAWIIARQHRSPASSTTPPPPNPNATDGEPGLGDPYYPQAGNSGYDVTKYQIMINWDPATQSITGTTTISAQATQRLNSFYVDLALHTDKVTRQWHACGIRAARGFSDVYIKPAATDRHRQHVPGGRQLLGQAGRDQTGRPTTVAGH